MDQDGYAHVTGYTFYGNFPLTEDTFETDHNEGSDVFVLKVSEDGIGLARSS